MGLLDRVKQNQTGVPAPTTGGNGAPGSVAVALGTNPSGGFLGRVEQMLPMFGLERFAEEAEKGLHLVRGLLQVRGGASRRGRGIVQFVGQTRGHGAERNEFFPLLSVAFEVPHSI